MFTFLGYFIKDAWLVDALCLYVFKGLLGWGFLMVPPCFFWAMGILFFHKGRPVRLRLVAVALIPLLFGAIVHIISCKVPFTLTGSACAACIWPA
jgi:S-DNA-T family DNA segregation ATPase FtsK/SpoIIIE